LPLIADSKKILMIVRQKWITNLTINPYLIFRSPSMAKAVRTDTTSPEGKRWSTNGICLNKTLTPN
jgi:hypothetical protein